MNNKLFQMYDTVAKGPIGPIFAIKSEAAAIRMFRDGLTDEKSNLATHPEDYELHQIGEQDPDTGEILQAECPQCGLKAGANHAPIITITGKQAISLSPATGRADKSLGLSVAG